MSDARKTAASSDGILDRIAETLVANDHEFRMARKVERLISSAAPGLGGRVLPDQYGRLDLDDVVLDVEPIDRQGRPVPEIAQCWCGTEHPEVFVEKTEFPVLRTVPWDGLGETGYVHFANYNAPPMPGYSYDEVEGGRR